MQADTGSVSVAARDGVAAIEFSHPKGNSLPGALLRQLAGEITTAGQRDDVNVVALRSAREGPFCAGASFDELVAINDEHTGKQFFLGFALVTLALIRCPKPVVTRVRAAQRCD
jgi:methylglutaconyl-CoA hydratase